MAGLVVGLWLVFPAAALIGLCVSVVHFGLGDTRAGAGFFRYVQVVAHGGVVVAGISQATDRRLMSFLAISLGVMPLCLLAIDLAS